MDIDIKQFRLSIINTKVPIGAAAQRYHLEYLETFRILP